MPRMDGITFLRRLMAQRPLPVVICSTLVREGSATFLAALEAGAVDVIQKPNLATRRFLEESSIRIQDAVLAAAHARLSRRRPVQHEEKLSADAMIPPSRRGAVVQTTHKVVAIGASTGGTEALRRVLQAMPRTAPPIVVVQHMPEAFTSGFARGLDEVCEITVREARDGDTVLPGQALIAPGSAHMLLARSGASYRVEVRDGPLVNRHRPSQPGSATRCWHRCSASGTPIRHGSRTGASGAEGLHRGLPGGRRGRLDRDLGRSRVWRPARRRLMRQQSVSKISTPSKPALAMAPGVAVSEPPR